MRSSTSEFFVAPARRGRRAARPSLRVGLAEPLSTHAADAAGLAQARCDIGLGSIVELSQAQLNKARADIERATARYDYPIRTAVLRYRRGAIE